MKKYLVVIVLMIGLVFNASARRHKISRKSTKGIVTSVTLSRGACFGRCPVYTLTVKSNGEAVYEGRNATEFLGTFEKQLKPSEVADIFKQAGEYRVDTLQNSYPVRVSDFPGLDLTFVINGKEKKVHNAIFGPFFLRTYAEFIDKTIKVDSTWKKTKEVHPLN